MFNVGIIAVKRGGFGRELIVNGGFDTASNWTFPTGWSRVATGGGRLRGTSSMANESQVQQSLAQGFGGFEPGKLYRVRFSVVAYTSGTVQFNPDLMESWFAPINAAGLGDYEVIWRNAEITRNFFRLRNTNAPFIGEIDNISAQEVL